MSRMFLPTILLTLLLSGCFSRVTQENFDRLQDGMSGTAVHRILGEPTESSSFDLGIISGTRSIWSDNGTMIAATFVQDKLQTKSFNKQKVKQQ